MNDSRLRARAVFKDVRRVVVKVGTHAIAKKSGRPDYMALRRVVSGICALRDAGLEVIFVSSGAVAAGIEALPGKVSAITDFPEPSSFRQLRRFCGLVNYYRGFIPRCASLLQPLTDLFRGKKQTL